MIPTDETRELIDQTARALRKEGHDVHVIRRKNRQGFKAGALAEGLNSAEGELIAIFDADFAPPTDYLKKVVPFFLENDRLGLVQARWGASQPEKNHSSPRVQSIGIDGTFHD